MKLKFKKALNKTTNSIAYTREGVVVLCKAVIEGEHNVMFTGFSNKTNEASGMPSTLFATPVTEHHQAFASKKGFITIGKSAYPKARIIDLYNTMMLADLSSSLKDSVYVADHSETEVQPTVGGIIYTIKSADNNYHKCVGVDHYEMLTPWALGSKQYAKQIAAMKPELGDIYIDRNTHTVQVSVIGGCSESPFGFTGINEEGIVVQCDLFTYVKGN